MTYEADTVKEYLTQLPEARRETVERLLEVIGEYIPEGFELCLSYGVPGFAVPHSVYPAGYHVKPEEPLPFVSVASQKNFIGFYHMGIYSFPELLEWFQLEWAELEIGRLDMGKSCIRLKKPEKIPYTLLGELCSKIEVQEWIDKYEESLSVRKNY
ncbi:MAG: DUF1801 domain-containing protein [Spirochaetales bacterium]|uniref:DUF1801 domain-containing protein n=1 Tax=Candidatus Thalassospirochaeta sargassi TaxID=3119039 RepID=A0AAJ1MIV1_9SPIO|nr:DUF1801 domain-containing protein [Spirochaetales bacterium]